jgi:hypothetical protein
MILLLAVVIALPTALTFGAVGNVQDNLRVRKARKAAELRAAAEKVSKDFSFEDWEAAKAAGVGVARCPYAVGPEGSSLEGLLVSMAETERLDEVLKQADDELVVGLLHAIIADQPRRARLVNMNRAA